MVPQTLNKNVSFFYPKIVGKDLIDYSELTNNAIYGLWILGVLLVWRAQLSSTLSSLLKPTEIQQLETSKFTAKQISTNVDIRYLLASIAVNRTLAYELKSLQNLKEKEERYNYLSNLVQELVTGTPPRGVKILSPSQINSTNLLSHRYAIMAALIGTWQSKPIYDPNSILKGSSTTLDLGSFYTVFTEVAKKILGEDHSSIPNNLEKAISILNKSIFGETDETMVITDGINFCNQENKLPLEIQLKFTRPIPTQILSEQVDPSETDKLIIRAAEAQSEAMSDLKRKSVKTSSKKTPDKETSKSGTESTPGKSKSAPPKASRKKKSGG